MHQQKKHLHHQDSQHSNEERVSVCSADHSRKHSHQPQAQQPATPHRHQQPARKHSHSHSPHQSCHTSPHSAHSHSLHSSPHQSHSHMGVVNEAFSPTTCTSHHSHLYRATRSPSASHSHHHHQHRRRIRRNGSGGSSAGGSGNSSFHGAHGHSHNNTNDRSLSRHSHLRSAACARRHRSATDVSSTSAHPITCPDREVQEIFVSKKCCSSSSRTELAQFFAEDLYGTSRRPSSCCTSSDYCYQTDSTSLYGSRSSLSRNNSIKSASVAMRKRRLLHQRQPSYTSISLRGLESAHSGKQKNLLDRSKSTIGVGVAERAGSAGKLNSRVTFERKTSKDALSQELPDYACSPSPIRWSFLEDDKSLTDLNSTTDEPVRKSRTDLHEHNDEDKRQPANRPQSTQPSQAKQKQQQQQQQQQPRQHYHQQDPFEDPNADSWESSYDECPTTATPAAIKMTGLETTTPTHGVLKSSEPGNNNTNVHFSMSQRRDSHRNCDFQETSTTATILFHQEGETFNNCCSNYIQCNTYLDQDLQITSEDIQQYLSKGNQQGDDILNNSKNYPFQPSNALEFQYKNNFANNNPAPASTDIDTSDCCDSAYGYEEFYSQHRRRRSSTKENKNANQHFGGSEGPCMMSSCSSTPLSPTNINLSSSTNNINIVFGTPPTSSARSRTRTRSRERNANEVKFINTTRNNVVSSEAHHSGYLSCNYPNYDFSNMSANSAFDKPLGIDTLPKTFENQTKQADATDQLAAAGATGTGSSTSEGQHSSPLPSPLQASFESFDAPSDHNLISQRGSFHYSSPTPMSPLSPGSPACSSMSAAIMNPAAMACACDNVQQTQQYCEYESQRELQQQQQQQPQQQHSHHHHRHHHHHHYQHQHQSQRHSITDSFKLGNALKTVRKRARKYTEFLRKK